MITNDDYSSRFNSSSSLSDSNINETEGVDIVNSILYGINIPIRIKSLNECVSSLWILLYEGIFKIRLNNTIRSKNAVYTEAKIMNIQIILDRLRADFGIPFSSKVAYELFSGNRAYIIKLIYIFKMIYDHKCQNRDPQDIRQELQILLQTLFEDDSDFSQTMDLKEKKHTRSTAISKKNNNNYNNNNNSNYINKNCNTKATINSKKKIHSTLDDKNMNQTQKSKKKSININKKKQNGIKINADNNNNNNNNQINNYMKKEMKPVKLNSNNDIISEESDNDYNVYKDDYEYYYFNNKNNSHNQNYNENNEYINDNDIDYDFKNNFDNTNENNVVYNEDNNDRNDTNDNDFVYNEDDDNDENICDHINLEDSQLNFLLNNNNNKDYPLNQTKLNIIRDQDDVKSISTQKSSKTNRTRSGTNKFIKLNDDIYNYIITNKIEDKNNVREGPLSNFNIDNYSEKLKEEYQKKSRKSKNPSKKCLGSNKVNTNNKKKSNFNKNGGKKKKIIESQCQPNRSKFQLQLDQIENEKIKKNHREIQLLKKEFSSLKSEYQSLDGELHRIHSKNPNTLMETHRMEGYLHNIKTYVNNYIENDQEMEKLRNCKYFHYIGLDHYESIHDHSNISQLDEKVKKKKLRIQKLLNEDPNIFKEIKNNYILEMDINEEENENENEKDPLKLKKKLTEYEFQRKITNNVFEKRRKTVAVNNLQKEINQILADKQNIIEFNESLERQRKLNAYKKQYRDLIVERNALLREAKKKKENEILLKQENMINYYKSQIDLYNQEAKKLAKDKQLVAKSYKEELRKIKKDYYQQYKKDISLLREKTKIPSDQFIF